MSRRLRLAISAALAAIGMMLAPAAALAAGNDVGHNLGSLLRQFAGELYGGFLAIVGLYFLINRKYTELGLYLVAAIVVGWLVFSPDQVAAAARAIGQRVLP